MNTPKLKFIDTPLSLEVDYMHGFLFKDQWGWGKYIIKKHPQIKKIFSLKTEAEQIKFLKNYITEFKNNNYQLIEKSKVKHQKEWQKIEESFFKILSEILQISWPKNRKNINALTSINPISPRFLNDWSFFINYKYKKISHAMEIIMHESCHFLYFEKFKKMYPKISHKKYESPYIEWHLSEIIAPIILNDQRINKLLKQKANFYDEHTNIKIENKSIPRYFTEIYKNSKNFEEFLENSYKLIKINNKLINKL